MITVDTPASFEWNDTNSKWVKNYLMPKTTLILSLTNGMGLDLSNLTESKFTHFCELLEKTAEGRELRNKMFKAWRSKKSRDSDNGKKMYTFNLSIDAGIQLKKIAKQAPLNKTLETLIFAGKTQAKDPEKLQQQIKQLNAENQKLKQEIETLNNDQADSLISSDLQVTELAKLEKSQLIKQILILKRKLAI
ncbi:hypothetical protein [Psychromonas algicola]|uniref:hypothetical protein n=1 Tax=Psychromonas algicola TaxID=2555642 RepID=UPI00106781FA|nr:hypothetical protein [Psychromonas sp. RZ5]TEW52993.1 hypothetical protein E2R67_00895 [Psychromonas sp. RZ5]